MYILRNFVLLRWEKFKHANTLRRKGEKWRKNFDNDYNNLN